MVRTFRGPSPLYFDATVVIIAFFLASRLVERVVTAKSARRLVLLRRALPDRARVFADAHERFVGIAALVPGKYFVVKTGERFAADGVVDRGESFVDESLFTGEAEPVAKGSGDTVLAGTVNLDNVLFVKATRTARHCNLSRMITVLEQALAEPSPFQLTFDRVARFFVPAVALLALATMAFCWHSAHSDFAAALSRAITVLVMACPCALALAAPLTVSVALGAASHRGVLISDARVLQLLGRVNHVVFEKTGTITSINFHIVGCELVPDFSSTPAWMQANVASSDLDPLPSDFPFDLIPPSYERTFALLASLEKRSEHPLAKAIVAFAHERNIVLGEPNCVELHPGRGITGMVDGKSLFLGGRRLTDDMAIFIDARSELIARQWEAEGRTVIFFGWDGGLQGCLAFGDSFRTHAFAMVAGLKRFGIEPHLISGDSRATTEAIAQQLGLESFRADLLPEQRAKVIREWQHDRAVVAMVGDGMTDASALAKADLSISMGLSPDLVSPAASIVLVDRNLSRIPEVFEIARKARRLVRQNLFLALLFNFLGAVLAVTGLVLPLFAAAAMFFSTLVVTGNSLRINPSIASTEYGVGE